MTHRIVYRFEFCRATHIDRALESAVADGLLEEAPGGLDSRVIDVYQDGAGWKAVRGWSPISRGYGAWPVVFYGRTVPLNFVDSVASLIDRKTP